MPLSDEERNHLEGSMQALQAELEAHRTLLFCLLVNTMAASGKTGALDDLTEQARFLVQNRQLTGVPPQEAKLQREATLQALDWVLADLNQARAAMERAGGAKEN